MKNQGYMPTTWSKMNTYDKCKWLFWLTQASKWKTGKAIIPFTSNKFTIKGTEIHALMEKHINYAKQDKTVPEPSLLWRESWRSIITKFVEAHREVWVEQRLAFDVEFKKAVIIDKYYNIKNKDQVVMFQGALDAVGFNAPFKDANKAVILDWKSGKVRPDKDKYYGQLATQAALLFCVLPNIVSISSAYVFLEHGKKSSFTYTRKEDFLKLKNSLFIKCDRIWKTIEAGKYPKSPGNCDWCAATKDQCEHGRG